MTTRKPDPNAEVYTALTELLRSAVAMLNARTTIYAEGGPAHRAYPQHAARITRRAASLRRATVKTQAAYERAERRAAGESQAGP
jgi:hypothetical protein